MANQLPLLFTAEVWSIPDSVCRCLVFAEIWASEWLKAGFEPKAGEQYEIVVVRRVFPDNNARKED